MVLKGISLLDIAEILEWLTATYVPYKSIFCFYV